MNKPRYQSYRVVPEYRTNPWQKWDLIAGAVAVLVLLLCLMFYPTPSYGSMERPRVLIKMPDAFFLMQVPKANLFNLYFHKPGVKV